MLTQSNVSDHVIAHHVKRFFPSLVKYEPEYLPVLGIDPVNKPPYFLYICPLCLKELILLMPGIGKPASMNFTPDHFPQQSVGSALKFSVHTCEKCNSTAGHEFENALKEKVRQVAFDKGTPSASRNIRSSISGVAGTYKGGKFIIDKDGKLEIQLKANDQVKAKPLDEWIEESKDDPNPNWTMTVTIPNASEKDVIRALVKSAFLFCFDYWGYDFAFNENARLMHKVITGEIEYPVTNAIHFIGDGLKFTQDQKIPLGLCYIKTPLDLRTYFVNMVLTDKESGCRILASVLVPNPTTNGWSDLGRIDAALASAGTTQLYIEQLHGFECETITEGYLKSWQMISAL